MALGKQLGKVVVLAGNCDGFIGNRMLQYYTSQSEFLMEQGASPEQIDRVAESFGMPMGPVSMRDMTGMDVGLLVRKEREKSLPEGERFSPILERLVAAGRTAVPAGQGGPQGRDVVLELNSGSIIETSSASVHSSMGLGHDRP